MGNGRIEDLVQLRLLIDLKASKIKRSGDPASCVEIFENVKNQELQRVNKENCLVQKFCV